jgi:hypothetical protein
MDIEASAGRGQETVFFEGVGAVGQKKCKALSPMLGMSANEAANSFVTATAADNLDGEQ